MARYKMGICFSKKFRINEQTPPTDVKAVFEKYTDGGTHMSADQLRRFLAEVQCERDVSVADAERRMGEVLQTTHHITKYMRHSLTLDDFFNFLLSEDLNPPFANKVHQDMDAPMSHYFIYTSHNTYLTGNQLSSECSDVPLIKALKRGVRAIELDLWPNSAKDDILVLHGWALTPPVELIRCLRSIKDHAFSASPYPVILTLENHLNPFLQAKAAEMFKQTFENMMFVPESGSLKVLPSPEELRYRIIISCKLPKEYLAARTLESSKNREKCSDEDASGKDRSDASADPEDDLQTDCDTGVCAPLEDANEACDYESRISQALKLKRIIAIPNGNAKNGLKDALTVDFGGVRRLSMGEVRFEKATALHGPEVVRFTQKNLLRIFPKATRVTSSNYKPLNGWMHGAQMVALNMQGYGRSLWLMHGMFKANGACGYVKKPEFLLNSNQGGQIFDPKAKLPAKTTLKVKVYLGDGWTSDIHQACFSMRSLPDFYTRVGVAGVPADKEMKRSKTKANTWMPFWDQEFAFPLTVPELALLRIEVHDHNMPEKDDFAGQTCLPLWELKQGIRAVPLFDRKGERLGSVRLLVRFEFV